MALVYSTICKVEQDPWWATQTYIPVFISSQSCMHKLSLQNVSNVESACLYADTLAGVMNWKPDGIGTSLLRTVDIDIVGDMALFGKPTVDNRSIACLIAWWHRRLVYSLVDPADFTGILMHMPSYMHTNLSEIPSDDAKCLFLFPIIR